MRTDYYLAVLLLLLDLTVLFQPTECLSFVKISVPTAFALITAAVKIKAIILKILFGLRALGVNSFYLRRRRRRSADYLLFSRAENDLLNAWLDLEQTLGKSIEFQLDSCEKSIKFKKKSKFFWTRLFQAEYTPKIMQSHQMKENYSSWISGLIGSITGRVEACHILHEELQHSLRETKFTKSSSVS